MEVNMNDIENKISHFCNESSWSVNEFSHLVFIIFKKSLCVTVDIDHDTIHFETKNESLREWEDLLTKGKDFLLFVSKIYYRGYDHGARMYC